MCPPNIKNKQTKPPKKHKNKKNSPTGVLAVTYSVGLLGGLDPALFKA